MKIVQSPAIPEKAVSVSDFSGKEFKFKTPEVQLNIDFNYGSKYDGARLSLDLFDSEASDILTMIFDRLHRSTRKHLEGMLKKSHEDYENCVEARDWSGCDQTCGKVALYQAAVKFPPRRSPLPSPAETVPRSKKRTTVSGKKPRRSQCRTTGTASEW